jgi:NADPH:quinone reductase-like Zn-dependent oxidoreductase
MKAVLDTQYSSQTILEQQKIIAKDQATQMKAVLYTKYGSPDVLEFQEIAKPVPNDFEVLVSIQVTAINMADVYLMRGNPLPIRFSTGLFKPKRQILGADIAGRIEAVGSKVKQFKFGDEVFGDLSGAGLGGGGFAEYVCAREDALTFKPAHVSFEAAAAVSMAAVTALQGLRDKGQIQAGQKVLIHGASGGVGTFAVQIAKALGTEVTAVCSTQKVELMRSLGADHVIDYTKEDFSQNGQHYDLILAANGNRSIFDYKRALSPNGIYVLTGGSMRQFSQVMLLGPLLSIGSQKMCNLLTKPNQKDLTFVKNLLETGKITPVIDRRYNLKDVPEALRYLEAGHAKGKVIINIGQGH